MPDREKEKMEFEDEGAIYSVNRPLLLEASAGSGKTTVLVERYLASVLFQCVFAKKSHYDAVRSVTAVTFTRKAASEMKDRVRSRIQDRFDTENLKETIAKLEKYNSVHADGTEEAVRKLAENKDELMQAVIAAPISTIHSFALSYLRAYPVESAIDPFAVTQDETGIEDLSITSADALMESMRSMIRSGNPDLAWMIKNRGYEEVRDMIKSLDKAVSGLGVVLTEKALRDERYFEYEDQGNSDFLIRKNIYPLLKDIRGRLEQLLGSVSSRSKGLVQVAMDKIGNFLVKDVPNDIFRDDLWYDGKTEEVLDEVAPVYEAVSRQKLKVFFPYLWRAWLVYWKTTEELKNHRKEISFSDIEIRFLDMLRAHPRIRDKIAGEISFLLIDEYQDTSDLQKEIFDLLIRGEGGSKPAITPFMVGDPKQSIFGFRNANVEVFRETRKEMETGENAAGVACYRKLNRNYRSTPALVRDINSIFRTVFRNSGPGIVYADQEAGKEGGSPSPGGAFFLPAIREEKRKVYGISALQASRLIRHLVADKGFAPGEIMVLLRKKTNLELLKSAFDEVLLPDGIHYYVVEDIADILQSREIRDLILYLRALENRESDHYFLPLLKSPFFRKSDPEILALRRSAPGSLYEASNRTPSGEMDIFNALGRIKNRMTIPELAEEIVTRTGYFAYLNAVPGRKEATTNLIVFLDFLRKIQDVEMFSLTDFLYYLQEYRVTPRAPQIVGEKSDVVRVMTVHMAKGLQARAVIYIAPYRKSDSERTRITIRKKDGRYGVFMNLFEKVSRRGGDPMREYLTEMQDEEEKRLAYVAVTRAKELFYYFGIITPGTDQRNDFWNAFIRSDEPCFSEKMMGHDTIPVAPAAGPSWDRRDGAGETALRKEIMDKMEYLRNNAARFDYERYPRILTVTQLLDMEFIGEGFRNRYITRAFPVEEALNEIADLSDILHESNPGADIGTFIHRVFQCAGPDHFRDYIDKTIMLENETIRSNRDKIVSAAEKFYKGKFYDAFFNGADMSRKEFEVNYRYAVAAGEGNNSILIKGSVDRYLRKNGKGILVDYKLTVPVDRTRYERQLQYYSCILGELGYPVDEMYLYDIMGGCETKVRTPAEASVDIAGILSEQIKKIAELYRQTGA